MFEFFSSIFESKKEKYSTATNIEDAEVLYFGQSDKRTQLSLIDSLKERNLDTRIIYQEDVEFRENDILIEGTSITDIEEQKEVVWRPNTFLNNKKTMEDLVNYSDLAESEKFNFTSDPLKTPLIGDKKETKRLLDSRNISTPQTYTSVDEINDALSSGEKVIRKNNFGKGGKGFEELVEPIDSLEDYVIYEECINHFQDDSVKDMRMYLVGGSIVSLAERETNSEQLKPKNLENGGYFKEVDHINPEELELAEKVTSEFGEGIFAVDYIRTKSGKPKVLEVNDTPGTKINNLDYDVDIFDEISCYLDSSESQYEGVISEKLLKDIDIVDKNSHQNLYNHGLYPSGLPRYSLKDIHRLAAL